MSEDEPDRYEEGRIDGERRIDREGRIDEVSRSGLVGELLRESPSKR